MAGDMTTDVQSNQTGIEVLRINLLNLACYILGPARATLLKGLFLASSARTVPNVTVCYNFTSDKRGL